VEEARDEIILLKKIQNSETATAMKNKMIFESLSLTLKVSHRPPNRGSKRLRVSCYFGDPHYWCVRSVFSVDNANSNLYSAIICVVVFRVNVNR
jgi:hypothetical protein